MDMQKTAHLQCMSRKELLLKVMEKFECLVRLEQMGRASREHVDLVAGGAVHQRLHHRPEAVEQEGCAYNQEGTQALGVMLGAQLQESVCDARVEIREPKAMEVRDPHPLLHWRLHEPDGLQAGVGLSEGLSEVL